MCIRDRDNALMETEAGVLWEKMSKFITSIENKYGSARPDPVSYTHLRAHETVLDLVCRLLLEKKKTKQKKTHTI